MDILIRFVLRSFHVKLFFYKFYSNFYFKLCVPLCVVILYGSLFFKVLFSPKLLLCDIFETLTLKFFPLNWREVFILSIPLSFYSFVMLYRLIFPLLEFTSPSVFPPFIFKPIFLCFSYDLFLFVATCLFYYLHIYVCTSLSLFLYVWISLSLCFSVRVYQFPSVSL